jgi:hypothetical protein
LYAGPTVQVANASTQEFERRVEAYLDLRRMLLQQLKPLLPTASARELSARQAQFAQLLRAARASTPTARSRSSKSTTIISSSRRSPAVVTSSTRA